MEQRPGCDTGTTVFPYVLALQPIGKYLTGLGHSSPLPARGMGQGQGQGLMDCPLFKADYNYCLYAVSYAAQAEPSYSWLARTIDIM